MFQIFYAAHDKKKIFEIEQSDRLRTFIWSIWPDFYYNRRYRPNAFSPTL